jgi:hypothetical protein
MHGVSSLDKASKRYRIGFRFDGKPYNHSLKITDRREANALLGRIEETILLIERGRLELPLDADPATFILSDGKRTGEEKRRERLTFKHLIDRYQPAPALARVRASQQSPASVRDRSVVAEP